MDKEKEILEGLLKKFAKEIGKDINVNEMMNGRCKQRGCCHQEEGSREICS